MARKRDEPGVEAAGPARRTMRAQTRRSRRTRALPARCKQVAAAATMRRMARPPGRSRRGRAGLKAWRACGRGLAAHSCRRHPPGTARNPRQDCAGNWQRPASAPARGRQASVAARRARDEPPPPPPRRARRRQGQLRRASRVRRQRVCQARVHLPPRSHSVPGSKPQITMVMYSCCLWAQGCGEEGAGRRERESGWELGRSGLLGSTAPCSAAVAAPSGKPAANAGRPARSGSATRGAERQACAQFGDCGQSGMRARAGSEGAGGDSSGEHPLTAEARPQRLAPSPRRTSLRRQLGTRARRAPVVRCGH